jgi:hypothetical protein
VSTRRKERKGEREGDGVEREWGERRKKNNV